MSGSETPIELTRMAFPEVTLALTARFAAASGDANAVHFDVAAAKAAGFDAPFAQGMLIMAWLGRLAENLAAGAGLGGFMVRFVAPVPIGARLTGVGFDKGWRDGQRVIGLVAVDAEGRKYAEGEARIGLRETGL